MNEFGSKHYRNLCISFIVAALFVLLAVQVFSQVQVVLPPIITAMLVAYLFYPVINVARRYGIPKWFTIIVTLCAVFALFVFIAYSIIPSVKEEIIAFSASKVAVETNGTEQPTEEKKNALLTSKSKLLKLSNDVAKQLHKMGIIKEEWDNEAIINGIMDWSREQGQQVLASVGNLAKDFFQFALIFIFVLVFALKDGDRFYKGILSLIPNIYFEPGVYMLAKTEEMMGYYIRGLVVETIIIGVLSYVLFLPIAIMTSLELTMVLSIAVIIALTNVVRFIGPVVGGAMGMILILTSSANFNAVFGLLIIVGIVQVLDSTVVLPLVMRSQINIHPVVCLISIIMGGLVAGVLGMILAIPIVGGVVVIYRIVSVDMKQFSLQFE
jgi:predicted PurR-regulated permease PerM